MEGRVSPVTFSVPFIPARVYECGGMLVKAKPIVKKES